MITSAIRYPKGDRYIRIHQSLLVACKGNQCAAALLAFFEEWHNIRLSGAPYTAIYNQMMDDLGEQPKMDTGQWQYHTYTQLQKAVLLYNQDTVMAALEKLEELEFISTDVPEHLLILFKTGRTNWYLLRTDNINEWFDRMEFELKPRQFPRQPTNVRPKDTEIIVGQQQSDAMTVFNYRNQRRVEAWKVRGKTVRYSRVTEGALRQISAHLRKGYTVAMLCYAVEGLVNNPFFMGENDKNTAFDDLKYLFKDDSAVRRHIAFAETKGIPFAEVERRLSGAPDSPTASQFNSYHRQLAAILTPSILKSDVNPDVESQLEDMFDENMPFDIDVLYRLLTEKVNEKAGMFTQTHKDRWKEFRPMLERIYGKT